MPLSGKTETNGFLNDTSSTSFDYNNNNSYTKHDDTKKRKNKNGEAKPHDYDWNTAGRVYPSTSSPSQAPRNKNQLDTPTSSSASRSPTRSPNGYRSSLPHSLKLEGDKHVYSSTPSQQQILQDTSSYHQVKMKYMRSLNFTPEELKSLRMRGRERSQTVSFPLGQSMPIPVAGLGHGNGGFGGKLSSSVYDGDDATSSSFVPPHELVKHDETFSVWHYEQKKIASKEAV